MGVIQGDLQGQKVNSKFKFLKILFRNYLELDYLVKIYLNEVFCVL